MKELVDIAISAAIRSAQEYLRTHGLVATDSALTNCIKAHVRFALPVALHDAKEAIDAHMGSALAQATFCASMALAGIEAAKEAGFPPSMVESA